MSIFSVIFPVMFLFGGFFWQISSVSAWNPEYGYDLPQQKRMCVERESANRLRFSTISEDQDCPPGSLRYVVVFGKKPMGAMALLRSTSAQKFYPPLVLSWPLEKKLSLNHLWHFTCVTAGEKKLLESKVKLYQYKGEITSRGSYDCLDAETRALEYCQKELKGETLLESCSIGWIR